VPTSRATKSGRSSRSSKPAEAPDSKKISAGKKLTARASSKRGGSSAKKELIPEIKNPGTLLASVPLFSGLSPSQLKTVGQSMKVARFAAGQTLIKEGDEDARFYLIVEGSAKVSARGRKVAILGPGDYVGEMAVIDSRPRSATVTAETDVVTLSAARWNFEALLRAHPAVMLGIVREMSRRVRDLENSPIH
jgi:signal-transduction protein with cAMP-binding, CBS, and nucleotidyltransferase domain